MDASIVQYFARSHLFQHTIVFCDKWLEHISLQPKIVNSELCNPLQKITLPKLDMIFSCGVYAVWLQNYFWFGEIVVTNDLSNHNAWLVRISKFIVRCGTALEPQNRECHPLFLYWQSLFVRL